MITFKSGLLLGLCTSMLVACHGQGEREIASRQSGSSLETYQFGEPSWLSVDPSAIDDVVPVNAGRRLFTFLAGAAAGVVEEVADDSGYAVVAQDLPANFAAYQVSFRARRAARIGQIDENGAITTCAVADISPLPPCDVQFFDFQHGQESKFHAFDMQRREAVGITQLWSTGVAREGEASWILRTWSGGEELVVWLDSIGRELRRERLDAYELEWPVTVRPQNPEQAGSIVLGGELIAVADSQLHLRVSQLDRQKYYFSIGSILAHRKSDGTFVVLADVFRTDFAIPLISGMLGAGFSEFRCRVQVDPNGLTRIGPMEKVYESSTEQQIDRRSVPIPVDEWLEGEPARVGLALVREGRDGVKLRCVASDIKDNIVATTSVPLPGFSWSKNFTYSRKVRAVCVRDAAIHVLFRAGDKLGVLRLTKRADLGDAAIRPLNEAGTR